MTAKPMYFHEMMNINVQMAIFGSEIQSAPPSPIFLSSAFNAPGGLEDETPAGANDDFGNDVRHENQGTNQCAALEFLVEQQGEEDGQRPLDDERSDDHE